MDLTGRVVVVTGSGRGLGRGYVEALGAAGASVVVNDVDQAAVDEAVTAVEAAGGKAVGVAAAVGSTETADALVKAAVDAFGRLDVMVTNAGILRDRVLWKMSDDDFDAVVNVHLRGTFTCARAAAVQMREQGDGGRLVLISSPAGQRGNFGQTNYAAAKAGIVSMARTWAMELAKAGIDVNAVVPVAATEMTKTIPAFAAAIEDYEQKGTPLPEWMRKEEGLGTIADVASLIVFLSSDASRGITGQAIGIGGDRLSLWSHPQEKAVALRDGGWSAEEIAADWATGVGAEPETYGIPMPEVPAGMSEPRHDRASVRDRDLDSITAIDVHTHVEIDSEGHGSLSPALLGASAEYFKAEGHRQPTIDEIAAYYRERNMVAVTFTVDAEHATGHRRISNVEVAEGCARNADVLIPFGSVDPWKGPAGVEEARRLVTEHGVRGFKFHPSIQGFSPNDPMAYPLYEAIEELGAIALFHTGQTGIGAGVPGWRRDQAEACQPDADRRRVGGLPRAAHHPGPPVVPLAGRGARGGYPQAVRLHRSVRLVAEVLPAAAGPLRQHPPAGQGALRLRLPGAHP